MTDWKASLGDTTVPKFMSLANSIERDVKAGVLAPGARLPAYRDLAAELGVSPGTVSKAYVEAKTRGLVDGEIGRGTFVRADLTREPKGEASFDEAARLIDMSINTPPMLSHNLVLADAFASLSRQSDLDLYNRYLPYSVHPQHRLAAMSWLEQHGLKTVSDDIVFTNGAQHAMAVALAAIAKPGDTVLTDQLTYPGIISLAAHLGLRLVGVEGDEEGMLPDSLAAMAKETSAKAVYLMPALQNPKGSTLGLERRRAIAKASIKTGFYVVEDDIYGLLNSSGHAPIKNLAPESTFYLTGMSKAVIPSLRIGFLVPPKRRLASVNASMRATGWTAAPLMVDVGARMIIDGTARQLAAQNFEEAKRRQHIAFKILGQWLHGTVDSSYHVWLNLPATWKTDHFLSAAGMSGIVLTPTEGLRVGPVDPKGVRLCLGTPRTIQTLELALRRLEAILLGDPKGGIEGLI